MDHNIDTSRSILVVDSDDQFVESFEVRASLDKFPVKAVRDGKNAQLILAEKAFSISGIFLNPRLMGSPNWISVLKCAHLNRPATPLYLICDDQKTVMEVKSMDTRKLRVKEALLKPLEYDDLLKLVAPLVVDFNAEMILRDAKAKKAAETGLALRPVSDTELDTELVVDEAGFIPIFAEDFLSGCDSFFDVYVKLGRSKFVKLLNAGDSFTYDRVESYLKKGVTYFYIKKEAHETYVAYCDHLATALLGSSKSPVALKVTQTLNQGHETMQMLKQKGMDAKSVAYAEKFVENLSVLVTHVKKSTSSEMRAFLNAAALYDHGVATSMIAGVLANQLQISTDKPIQIIGVAALFHDVGLSTLPEKYWDEDDSALSPQELKIYQAHPTLGARILEDLKTFHPSAIQGVEQHHMRIQGGGFPKRTGTTLVSRVAEIVGLSCEINHCFKKNTQLDREELVMLLERTVFSGFSRVVVNAAMATLFSDSKLKQNSS